MASPRSKSASHTQNSYTKSSHTPELSHHNSFESPQSVTHSQSSSVNSEHNAALYEINKLQKIILNQKSIITELECRLKTPNVNYASVDLLTTEELKCLAVQMTTANKKLRENFEYHVGVKDSQIEQLKINVNHLLKKVKELEAKSSENQGAMINQVGPGMGQQSQSLHVPNMNGERVLEFFWLIFLSDVLKKTKKCPTALFPYRQTIPKSFRQHHGQTNGHLSRTDAP